MSSSSPHTDMRATARKIDAPVMKYLAHPDKERDNIGLSQQYIYTYMDLNEAGLALRDQCESRFQEGDVKGHMYLWFLEFLPSGPLPGGVDGPYSLNSHQNYQLRSPCSDRQNGNRLYLKTSHIVMMDTDKKWAVTSSGSLYSLGTSWDEDESNIDTKVNFGYTEGPKQNDRVAVVAGVEPPGTWE